MPGLSPVEWKAGEPLKLLFADMWEPGTPGQMCAWRKSFGKSATFWGPEQAELTVMTVNPNCLRVISRRHQVVLPAVFPKFLFEECPRHHGVISCEGSMFKSKFANALSTMMAGSLGMANAEGKLSVGYGAEAGAMTDDLENFVRKQCRTLSSCVEMSLGGILSELGIRTTGGTDTAWTFEPAPDSRGEALLRQAGWDGENPFLPFAPSIHSGGP